MNALRNTDAGCAGNATLKAAEATRSQTCNSTISSSAVAACTFTSLVNGSLATSWAISVESCRVCQQDAAKLSSQLLRRCTACEPGSCTSLDLSALTSASFF